MSLSRKTRRSRGQRARGAVLTARGSAGQSHSNDPRGAQSHETAPCCTRFSAAAARRQLAGAANRHHGRVPSRDGPFDAAGSPCLSNRSNHRIPTRQVGNCSDRLELQPSLLLRTNSPDRM